MKSDKEGWTFWERLKTFMNTPHEGHSFINGVACGISEGKIYKCNKKYEDEEHYFALGWSIGEIIDRILNDNPEDTKMALAQSIGIIIKYIIVGLVSSGFITLLFSFI